MKRNDDGILEINTLWTLDGFKKNKAKVKIGDRIKLPEFTVPNTIIKGQNKMLIEKLKVSDEAIIVGKELNGNFIFVFHHCLFKSAIDLNNTKVWAKTQLYEYLRSYILQAMQKVGIDVIDCDFLSYDEVFGENCLEYFSKGKNRIAFDFNEDFPKWYWLNTLYKDKASAAYFCRVNGNGDAHYSNAGYTDSYVRPRFVLAV